MKYYAGVYRDEQGKVMQVSNGVDGLSCELLADPGVMITNEFRTVADMVKTAKVAAHFLMCHHLEVNCDKGQGSYQYIKA